MSVYADEMGPCVQSDKWPYPQACHLAADSVEELHYFAGRMRLKPSWFQEKSDLPHYDLTPGKRAAAVRLGAVEITNEKMIEIMKKNRSRRAGQQSLLF